DSVYDRVKKGYDEEFDVKWLEPLGFENAYTLTYAPDSGYEAETISAPKTMSFFWEISANSEMVSYAPDSGYEAETISELAEISQKNDMVFGAPHPFYERVGEGYDDLVEAFPFDFSDTKSIDPNIMYDAVEK